LQSETSLIEAAKNYI